MRIAWKPLYLSGFILFLIFPGCGEKELPLEEQVLQAETLLDAGQIESAVRILEHCRERAPERVDILESLAFAYSASGDPILASFTFTEIAEIVPGRSEYLLYAAESLLEAGDRKGAVSQYERYLERRPEDRAVWVALADLHIEQGRLNKALEALLEAEKTESQPRQQLSIGDLYLRKDNLAQAQSWFGRALEGGAEVRDEALLGLLETAVRARRFADAEALVERLDAEYPGRLEQSPLESVRDQLVAWRERREAAREAVAALDDRNLRLPQLSPGEPASEGVALDEAVPGDEREVAERPPEAGGPERQSADAVVAEPLGEARDGVAMESAREAESRESAARTAAGSPLAEGRAAREAGNLQEAIRQLKRALVLDDTQSGVWAELSELYLEVGNDRWAQATASEAMRRDPDNPKRVLQFLRAAQRTMDSQRLIREMEAAYRKFPRQPELVRVLARAYADEGNFRNARLLFREFLNLVPEGHPSRPAVESELSRLGG